MVKRPAWRQSKDIDVAEPIDPEKLVEEIVEGNFRYKRRRVLDKITTTNRYEEATESFVFDARLMATVLAHIINEHASNAILYRVLGSIDAKTWTIITAEATLNGGANISISYMNIAWAFIKIQIKASVADSQGIVTAFIAGKSP